MNINRDYLIINDVKKSNVKLDNGSIFFYITDKNTQNIFVNLVINVSNNDLIQKYANIENAKDYTLTMNIVKPSNTFKVVEGKLHDKEKAIFEFNLEEDCCDEIGTYRCELLTKCNINDHEEITTSNKITYKVKSSVLNDLDDIVEAPEYPLVIQLFDKLSDIEQYEEDRRANELARQLAEEQRQTRFDALDADMTDSIQAMDNKVVEVENRITAKEQAVDKLVADTKADIDEYKVAKDQEIDEYKTAKDTEINNAITAQDNKIDTAISNQNNRIAVVENNDVAQDNRLDTLENRATQHESRLTDVEAKNTEQDNRLDIVENKNTQQDNRLDVVEAKNVEQDNRLDDIEAIDVAQNSRLDAIEVKNQQQDDRLLDIEKVNKRQDMDLKCLFAESKNNMIDITEEGNSIYLQNSTIGYTLIDEIKGNTLVNCNKEPDKELILNGEINTSGDNTVTLTKGVDGGLVDVALEGNTLVNVSKTKDSTALPLDEELTYLYASTRYTVQFISDKATTADITLGGTQLLAQNIVQGLNRISIATPSELANNKLIIDGLGAKISEIVVTDTDKEFGYFEGMKSVGEGEELEVISTNSNLLDNSTYLLEGGLPAIRLGETFNDKARPTHSNGRTIVHYPCKPNTTYYLTGEGTLDRTNIVGTLNKDKVWVANNTLLKYSNKNGVYSITTTSDSHYLEWYLGQNANNIVHDVILSEYPISSGEEYIPHQSNTQQLTHEPLRAVGGVKDRYVLLNGNWYIERKCGIRAYQEGDKGNYKTDLINTVYPLEMPTYEEIDYNPLEVYSGTTHITTNSIIPTNIVVKNHGFNCLLKPNTTYTISSNLGLNTVTTPSILTEDCLRFMDTDTSDVTTMRDVLVLEGDWTTKADLIPNNFSGIESVFEQELITDENDANYGKYKVNAKVVGKNLYNPNNRLLNKYINNGKYNYSISNNNAYDIIVIPVKNRDKIAISINSGIFGLGRWDDINGNLIEKVDGTYKQSNAVLTPPCTNCTLKICVSKADINNNIQIEEGDTATEYEPYKENNITFYIDEPLRGVGDVKDRVFIKDDKVVVQRNCGSVTFDGSEKNWRCETGSANETRFGLYDININIAPGTENALCSTYYYYPYAYKFNTFQLMQNGVRFNNDNHKFTTVAQWTQWLQQNPTTIVYQLAEPVYEEVEYNDAKLFIESFKNSTLFYNSNVPVSSKLYYSYSVPIVDTVARTASITDEQDSMIIDLATQCAVMEMMLM